MIKDAETGGILLSPVFSLSIWFRFRLLGVGPVRALAAGVRVVAGSTVMEVVQLPVSAVATVVLVVLAAGHQLLVAAA